MLRYVGKSWLPGVPMRDLTADEVARFGKAFLLATGLYEEDEQPKPARTAPKKRAAPDDTSKEG